MPHTPERPEFWEAAFVEKGEMWGASPARSAVLACETFRRRGVKTVLIPGIGYGRNAAVFREAGMAVTGIEISRTALDLARAHGGDGLVLHHGSVTDMPFDNARYDGIFCHALIHLLDAGERAKLIRDCSAQLAEGGIMLFSVISKAAPTYGQGTPVGKDRYEQFGGVRLFFYDRASIAAEFGPAGLLDVVEVDENFPFFLITCGAEGRQQASKPTGVDTA